MAKMIFSVVDLLPPGTELPDRYSVYETLCDEDPDGRIERSQKRFEQIEATLSGEAADIEHENEMNEVYGTYQLRSLEYCLEGMPNQFIDYVDLPRPDLGWLYQSLVNNTSFRESFDSFLQTIDKHPKWPENLRLGQTTRYACNRYDQARSWYRRLYMLADFLQHYEDGSYWPSRYERVFGINSVAVNNGRIDFEPDKFTEAFVGVRIERIKTCKNCGRVFWMKRDDMKGCSTSCAKILRTRKWREKVTPEQKQKYYIDRMHRELNKGEKQWPYTSVEKSGG